jgi:hypothetical protein
MAFADGVFVHFEGVGAVFELIGDGDAFGRQLFWLTSQE